MEISHSDTGLHTKYASHVKDEKRLRKNLISMQATQKEMKRRQGQQLRRVQREEALREAQGGSVMKQEVSMNKCDCEMKTNDHMKTNFCRNFSFV